MPVLRSLSVEVTLDEAEARWQSVRAHIRSKMGDDYREPSEYEHAAALYEHMSGDFVWPSEIHWLEDWDWCEKHKDLAAKTYGPDYVPNSATRRLRFWTEKYQLMRDVADSELKAFLIDQINAARRG